MPRRKPWMNLIVLLYLAEIVLPTSSLEDFSIEHECDESLMFRCRNKKCISKSFVCDGEVDCGGSDHSDEEACHLLTTPSAKSCSSGEFQCADRLCIPLHFVCDSEMDCPDGSDETHGCEVQTCEGFRCKSGGCLPKEWECDGTRDCPDHSDEENCRNTSLSVDDCNLHDGKWLCTDRKKCIRVHEVCNMHADCDDGSDEGKECHDIDACTHKVCGEHERCILLPEGPECLQLCSNGYKFKDGQCEDLDECLLFGTCDQLCTNAVGGYNCSCVNGYNYSAEHGYCKAEGAEGLLLFSSNDQIRGYFISSQVYFEVATGLPHATGIAYDGQSIYWTTIAHGEEAIVKSNEVGENQRIIVTSGLGSPEDLAIDWITKTLYFTDPKLKHIGACSNDGYICTILHNKNIDKPRALVLHATEGLMYWTDWGNKALIGRSGMDGSNPVDFVTKDLVWPNGLSLDLGTQRLFWVDAKRAIVECIKLDGSDRRAIPNAAVKHPFSVDIFENKIYWSDWDNSQIVACNKFTGHDCHIIVREKDHKIYGIHIYHPALFGANVVNPCLESYCSDHCILSPRDHRGHLGYTCVCPPHKVLSQDKHTCVEDTKLEAVIVGSGQNLVRVEHKVFGGLEWKSVHIPHVRKIGALAYDPLSDRIIMSDLVMKNIVAYDWKKEDLTVLSNHVGSVVGMDVDYYANNLYWVDEEKKTIEVMDLKHYEKKTLLRDFGNESPTDIALVLEQGYMFVAFRDNNGAHIDKISMDGRLTSRTHVIESELIGPLSLFYDSALDHLIWTDRNGGLIMTTDSDGIGRHRFQEMDSAPIDVTTLDSDVFWSTYGSNKLYWSHKYDSSRYRKELVLEDILETDHIRLVGIHTHEILIKQPCAAANCSHLCLQSGKSVVCACPDGMQLQFDLVTCQTQHICKEDEYKCSSGECIPRKLRCNRRKDCKDGDDEEHCTLNCPHGTFSCANGRQCISHEEKCDNKPDCDDSSDEHNCDTGGTCSSYEFRCGSGECISIVSKCDTHEDCSDGSDEEHCAVSACRKGEFRCDSGSCIPETWECDSQIDCVDGSDEGDKCNNKKDCAEFKCDNGHCISQKLKCNGEDDCEDMSDEFNCHPSTQISATDLSSSGNMSQSSCPFVCASDRSVCLPLSVKCNGKQDCPGGEDEKNCTHCSDEQFACKTGKCIPKSWACDNVNDCGDNSDEIECMNKTFEIFTLNNSDTTYCSGFRCKTGGLCISTSKLCDSHPDCPDESDEKGLCGHVNCKEASCSQECHETPEGPKCGCHHGYRLSGDGRTCYDIDECERKSSCSQICHNTLGGFKCACHEPDYQLRSDRIRCKAKGPEMKYYYATQREIKFKSQSLQETGLVYRSQMDLDIKGLVVDMKNNTIYWTSEIGGHVTKMSLEKSGEITKLSHILRPTSLGYDWITGNIYLLENSEVIKVCNFELLKCSLLYKSDKEVSLEELVLDPLNRIMFWTETKTFMMHHTKKTIMKASMDGTNVTSFLNLTNALIGGLVTDHLHKLIYWSDTSGGKIERCTYDGSERELVLHSELSPTKLMIFEDYLYWLNGKTATHFPQHMESVSTLTKYGLYGPAFMKYEEVRLLPRVSYSELKAVSLSQPALQPQGVNKCKRIKCQELCLIGTDGPSCLCENGDKVMPGKQCTPSSHTKSHFQVININESGENGTTAWTVFWWIFGLISFSALGCATYYFYINYYQPQKLRKHINVFFSGHRSVDEDVEPNVQTSLAPGQHQYENPLLQVVT